MNHTKRTPTFRLTGRHILALNDARDGVDFLHQPEELTADLSTKDRWAMVGKDDHELVQEVYDHRPELVEVSPPMGRNPHAVLGAILTSQGLQVVNEYLRKVDWRLSPRTHDAGELLTNYNEFVESETMLDPITETTFLELVERNATFKQRWAPLL